MKPIWKKKERKQQIIETMKRITPDERKKQTKMKKTDKNTAEKAIIFSLKHLKACCVQLREPQLVLQHQP